MIPAVAALGADKQQATGGSETQVSSTELTHNRGGSLTTHKSASKFASAIRSTVIAQKMAGLLNSSSAALIPSPAGKTPTQADFKVQLQDFAAPSLSPTIDEADLRELEELEDELSQATGRPQVYLGGAPLVAPVGGGDSVSGPVGPTLQSREEGGDMDSATGAEPHNDNKSLWVFAPTHALRRAATRLLSPSGIAWRPTCRTMCIPCFGCCGTSASRLAGTTEAGIMKPTWRAVTFDNIVLVCIILSSITLAIDCPQTADYAQLQVALLVLEIMFVCLFILEMFAKIIAHGFMLGEGAYLRDPYNALDFVVVTTSCLSLIAQGAGAPSTVGFFRVVRIIRTMRPLRVLSRSVGMRSVIDALYYSIGPIFNILAVLMLLWSIFAIAGVQLFSGALDYCNDPAFPPATPLTDCVGNFVDAKGVTVPRAILTPTQNFDNYPNAMLHLFICSTGEDWPDLQDRIGNIVSVGYSGSQDNTWYFSYYHVLFISICVFIGLNLFVAVLYSNFVTLQRSMDGLALLTERQREWVESQRVLLRAQPIKVIGRPKTPWRRRLWFISHSTWYSTIMNVAVICNMALLGAQHWQQPESLTQALLFTNLLFITCYTAEAGIKILGFGITAYWKDRWLRLELLLVVLGVVDLIVSFAAPNSQAATAFRVLRALRGLRLIRVFKGLETLIDILIGALPRFANVGSVLVLVVFVYAVAGVSLFGHLDLGVATALDFHNNFLSVPNAMLLLLRTSTGEGWDTLMFDCVNPDVGGGAEGYVYWLSYVVLINFVMLQMFMMVIVDSYQTGERQKRGASESQVRSFKAAWRMFDPRGTGFIIAADLNSLLLKLPRPMGLKEGSTFGDYVRYTHKLQLATWGGMVAFSDVLLGVHRVTYGVGVARDVIARMETSPQKVQAMVTARIRHHLKRKQIKAELASAISKAVSMPARRGKLTPIDDHRPRRGAAQDVLRAGGAGGGGGGSAPTPRTQEVELPAWVAASPAIQQRWAARHAMADKTAADHAAALSELQRLEVEAHRRRLRRKDAMRRSTLYRSKYPPTAVAHPLKLVVVSERIQRSFREWRERAAAKRARAARSSAALAFHRRDADDTSVADEGPEQ